MKPEPEIKSRGKVYNPQQVEEKWYSFWESKNLFRAEAKDARPPFSIVIPPPNVTGSLHMGHALNNTLQDVLARYKRMDGFNVAAVLLPLDVRHVNMGIASKKCTEWSAGRDGRKLLRVADQDDFCTGR